MDLLNSKCGLRASFVGMLLNAPLYIIALVGRGFIQLDSANSNFLVVTNFSSFWMKCIQSVDFVLQTSHTFRCRNVLSGVYESYYQKVRDRA